ncbi:MAG: hypothetical protein CBD95_005295 [Flavobacteriales bacterium TMED235]|nr:MAG: hypothetical protein CBD95_005295 [Flavobacteriales bacterium TMED235]
MLKEILNKFVPKDTFNRLKIDFGVSLVDWFRDELRE